MSEMFGAMGIARLKAGLAAKEFSAAEVAQGALARIAEADQQVHSFLEVTEQMALAAAAQVDKAIAAGTFGEMGILAGVPVAFKDNMNLEGTRTTCSSRMLENYVSPYTATCVEKCLQAGALPMGKLNMDEFAFGSSTETSAFGPTRNPWDLQRVPGGSSGGSAAAVAAGLVCATLGSDTGGSIRQPGAFCGVVGLKPTYGTVSRYGVVAFGSSLDQVGPFTRSVEDAALMMNVLAGRDPLDCTSQPCSADFTANLAEGVRGMRIGVVPEFMEAKGLTDEVRQKVADAIKQVEALGAQLVEIDLPHARAAMSAYYVLGPSEAFSNLARFDSVRYGYCDPGHTDLGSQYDASRRWASALRPSAASCWAATCFPPACTTSTITRPSRCAPLSSKTTSRPTKRWIASSRRWPLAPLSSSAKSAIPPRCTSPTCSPSPSTLPVTAACPCRWVWGRPPACRWACSSFPRRSTTPTCCGWPRRWKRCTVPRRWPQISRTGRWPR